MAENNDEIKHEPGLMDITEQERVFQGFVIWTVRTMMLIALVLIFLAMTQT